MDRAVQRWVADCQLLLEDAVLQDIIKKLSRTYIVYGDMILLPPNTIDSIFQAFDNNVAEKLCRYIAKEMKITHIAVNSPIPPDGHAFFENILRAPIHFKPIFGEFGPDSCSAPPSPSDFDQAYWVTAKQNGISQTWAPRWTMFSRGNISEKARILTLPSVEKAVTDGVIDGRGCSAIDLYAGIGYFTFSYLKAGVSKVLCWELNEWSCEGLRRGAKSNKWQSKTCSESTVFDTASNRTDRLLIFNESNELAISRLKQLRSSVPPIRHVNCGLLPTSQGSWKTAVEALDPEYGGWLHVHENFGADEIEFRAAMVRDAIQSYVDTGCDRPRHVVLESINRVKTYAPGVWHCVLDLYIPALQGL